VVLPIGTKVSYIFCCCWLAVHTTGSWTIPYEQGGVAGACCQHHWNLVHPIAEYFSQKSKMQHWLQHFKKLKAEFSWFDLMLTRNSHGTLLESIDTYKLNFYFLPLWSQTLVLSI
jgi:hypothetical protein